MPASIRSLATGKNTGGNTFTVPLPPGIQAGDLWVVSVLTGTATGYTTDNIPKKWWKLDGWDVNTRQYSLFARIYNPADAETDYTLTQNASAFTKIVSAAVMGHAVTQQSDIVMGTRWRRGDNGGSQPVVTALSMTTTLSNMLVLATTGEASNALGSYTVTTASSFTLAGEITEGPTANSDIEWITLWSKVQATAGATGALTINYGAAASLNGIGQQIAIPSAADVPLPATGRIGARIATSVSHNSITMGVDRLGGDVVQIAAKLGATEISRQTVAIDSTSGWGSATFTGLMADSHYGFEFYVDGVLQTDTEALIRTYPKPGTPTSFKYVTGSCQFTGSNHPVWDRILDEGARGLGHMGDLHYADATTLASWRSGVETSLAAPRMRAMLGLLPMTWTWDNHDRIITDDGGAGNGLNFGKTDPATLSEWKRLAGANGWATSDSGGRTWVIGRVRFIQTDNWTNKTDPDAGLVPANQQTFLGAAQKQWFKDTLASATEPIIVWLAQWTTATTGSGRWNSYPTELAELEAWINARPLVKSRMVMIGGDSHSVQVTDGSRTEGNFDGIPSYNISGFNRSSDSGQGGTGWLFDGPLRTSAQLEADWGGYSRLSFTDTGSQITLLWEGVRVSAAGTTDVMASQTITKAAPNNIWAALDLTGLQPGTKLTAANTDNFFDLGYPASADRLVAASVTGGGIGMKTSAAGANNAAKSLAGHTAKGRIGWKMEFLTRSSATSYFEMLALRYGTAAEFLVDVGLRHNATTVGRYIGSRNNFSYIGQTNVNLDAGAKASFEVYWDGLAATVYVWMGEDTTGTPSYTWTATMAQAPTNFLFANDSADGVEAVLYDLWVSDGDRREAAAPIPGSLNWIGNWDARHDRLQVVGKVTNASSVTLTINGGDVSDAPDANGYFRIDVSGLVASTAYPWDLKVDGVSRQTGSIKTLPAPNAQSHRVLLGSCYDSYTSGVFALLAARNADLVLHGGDRGYSWLSSSPNGPQAPSDAPGVRSIREQVYAAVNNRQLIDYTTPLAYIYSDTDGAGANSDSSFPGFVSGAVQEVYRQQVANVELPLATAAARSFVMGMVRYIITDETTMASPKGNTDDASKTKLGAEQKAWLLDQITQAAAAKQAVVWFGDGPFHAPKTTTGTSNEWSRYDTERQEIAAHIVTSGVKLVRANGDRHALAIDSGANNPFGGFPTVNAAPFHTTANPYGMAASGGSHPSTQTPSSRQYAQIDATYDGAQILLRFRGFSSTVSEPTEVQRYDMTLDLSYPTPTITADVSGSGNISALVESVVAVEISLTGSGEVTSLADIVVALDVSLTGSGEVTTTIVPVAEVQALPTGSGALTAALSVEQDIDALPTGSGALSMVVSTEESAEVDAPLSGSGTVTATTSADMLVEISIDLSGSSALTAEVSSELLADVQASLTGSGAVTAATSAEMVAEIEAIFAGAGALSAVVGTEGSAETDALLAGSGDLSMEIAIEQILEAPFTGSGSISATLQSEDAAEVSPQLTGSGSLSAEIEIFTSIQADFSGTGSITIQQDVIHQIDAEFAGSGTVVAVAWPDGDGPQIFLNGHPVVAELRGLPITIST